MAARSILAHPDPRLRAHGRAVTAFDADLAGLASDLTETMRAHGIIGLSAHQLGDDRRVCVIDPAGDGAGVDVFINPEILARWRTAIVEERCQSLPGIKGKVFRATRLRVRAQDLSGTEFVRDLEDMAAVALQHELDHLDGKLFIDRLNPLRRFALAWRYGRSDGGSARASRRRA